MPHLQHLSLAVLALCALAPTRSARAQDRGPFRIDTTVSVGRDASVDLSLVSGDIVVTAGTGGDVRVKAYSETIPLRFERVGNSVRVSTENGRYRRSGEQRMDVVVPVGTRVIAASVSGDVSVRGVRGEIEASSVSSDVTVEGIARRGNVSSVSGSVRVRDVAGDLKARSTSGDVTVERITGEVDAETVSGEVDVRGARSDRVHMQSVSGELTYDGTLARDGRYDLSTHSGNVHLVVPGDAGISLGASTFSGSVNSKLPAQLGPSRDGVRRGQRMDLTINGGGARVAAQTFSGDIVIDRASGRPDRER